MKTVNECLEYAANHPWLKKSFSKLKKHEVAILVNFLAIDFANKDEAMKACNRMFIDKEKTKNWTSISEVASGCITHRFHQ
jgi:hypothetical protein